MSNLHTAIAEANEIMKASDFTFGYDSSIENVTTALRVVLSNSAGDFIIGGKVKPYGSGGLNVSVDPIYAYHDSTKTSVAETEITEPIAFERADDSFNRIDIVQVRGIKEGYDTQLRKFNDPQTGAKTNRQVPTKKCVRLEVSVKKGANGSDIAPTVDAGCVKIAEVIIPAGTLNITENLIKNVTAQKYQDVNENWTANKEATFTPGYLTDTKQEMDAHAENTANPHKVTAAQTGAYTKQETDAKITAVDNNITTLVAHTKNTANPHKVTASQTGAYTKQETDARFAELIAHGGSTDGRNLLKVFGKTTVAEVMAILHKKCNGEGKADFSGLMIGDYLDLPSLTVGGTTYKGNTAYQNLRIVISGFNHYIYCGYPNVNEKNHILWTFRNVVLQKRINATHTNIGGYKGSELKKYLDEVFATGLGNALGSSGYLYTIMRTMSIKGAIDFVTDTVFLPTEGEVFGVSTYGDDQILRITSIQYPIYRDSSFYRAKKYNGSRSWWWEGTPSALNAFAFCVVGSNGVSSEEGTGHDSIGVAPAFCTC